jgi:P pilus assembly chaperone PapD
VTTGCHSSNDIILKKMFQKQPSILKCVLAASYSSNNLVELINPSVVFVDLSYSLLKLNHRTIPHADILVLDMEDVRVPLSPPLRLAASPSHVAR